MDDAETRRQESHGGCRAEENDDRLPLANRSSKRARERAAGSLPVYRTRYRNTLHISLSL